MNYALRPLVVLVCSALLLSVASCSKDNKGPAGDDNKKITLDSTDDATSPIVDQDYRFRIDWPGTGWKLMRERDARKMSPDALAAAMYTGSLRRQAFGVVIVERAPGAELDSFAQLVIDNLELTGKKVESNELTKYQGKPARRAVITGSMQGMRLRYVNQIFIHQDHVYQVLGGGSQSAVGPDGATLQPFFNSFKLLEGKVTGRSNVPDPVRNAHGVGWQLEEGVYQSGLSGMQIKPPAEWRMAVGGELDRMNADAEVGMVRSNPDAYIVFIPERIPGINRAKFRQQLKQQIEQNLEGAKAKGSVKLKFARKPTALFRYSTKLPFEYLCGLHFEGDLAIQIFAWYAAKESKRAMPAVEQALASVSFLDRAKAEALIAALDKLPDPQNAVGPDFSLRRGIYQDYQHRLRWTKPAGPWSISVGEKARKTNKDVSLHAQELGKGLYGQLIVESAQRFDQDSYHRTIIGNMTSAVGLKAKTAGAHHFGTTPAMVSEGIARVQNQRLQYRVATAVSGATAAQMVVWGYPADMKTHAKSVTAFIEGLNFVPSLVAVERSSTRYADHRFGFAIKPPSGGWLFSDMTPTQVGNLAAFATWKKSGNLVGVLAMCVLDLEQDPNWFESMVTQTLRTKLGSLTKSQPKVTQTTVKGHRARQVSWSKGSQRIDALLLRKDLTFYALVVVDRSPTALESAKASFELL